MPELILALELIGTAAFAVSGAVTGVRKGMDVFGVAILGLTTAVGGGVVRDLLLGNTPPVTFHEPVYALTALGVSLIVFLKPVRHFLLGNHRHTVTLLQLSDSLGLSLFTVSGVQVAYGLGHAESLFLLTFVGVVTGVGGGVLRDIMAGRTPYIFVKHVYASAALAGALLCAALWPVVGQTAAMLTGFGVVMIIRLLSAHYRWSLPHAEGEPPADKAL